MTRNTKLLQWEYWGVTFNHVVLLRIWKKFNNYKKRYMVVGKVDRNPGLSVFSTNKARMIPNLHPPPWAHVSLISHMHHAFDAMWNAHGLGFQHGSIPHIRATMHPSDPVYLLPDIVLEGTGAAGYRLSAVPPCNGVLQSRTPLRAVGTQRQLRRGRVVLYILCLLTPNITFVTTTVLQVKRLSHPRSE